ncbi:hypothetical protein [Aeribacillus pallidus]|uniref:hypothetical protein n=1 Tax=Aeribacillus pallidus TaxID=33936 RepID=UPI003D242098
MAWRNEYVRKFFYAPTKLQLVRKVQRLEKQGWRCVCPIREESVAMKEWGYEYHRQRPKFVGFSSRTRYVVLMEMPPKKKASSC